MSARVVLLAAVLALTGCETVVQRDDAPQGFCARHSQGCVIAGGVAAVGVLALVTITAGHKPGGVPMQTSAAPPQSAGPPPCQGIQCVQ